MKKTILLYVILMCLYSGICFSLTDPYGVNSWYTPYFAQDKLAEAGIFMYRDAVIWAHNEPVDVPAGNISDSRWNWWTPWCGVLICQHNPRAKLMLMISDVPDWASPKHHGVQFHIQKACEYVSDLLKYCDQQSSGCVRWLDYGNEMYVWETYIERDPSWFYGDLIKEIYRVVKAHNSNILVTAPCVFTGVIGEDVIDQFYQIGMKGYFDRVTIHYYIHHKQGNDRYPLTENIDHYPTVMRYMKYLCEQNNDYTTKVCNSEYGWILNLTSPALTEEQKAENFRAILEVSRKSGFCDVPFMYPAYSGGYPNSHHSSALIYGTNDEETSSMTAVYTASYYMYKQYAQQYPQWTSSDYEPLITLTPASSDVNITNPGFEAGNTNGWNGATLDTQVKHSGNASGRREIPGTISTINYPVEPNRLYEITVWGKVEGDLPCSCIVSGIGIDTRRYPGGWKRVRSKYYTGSSQTQISLSFEGKPVRYWNQKGFNQMYFILVDAPGATISNISRTGYSVAGNFAPGQRMYTDIDALVISIPGALSSLQGIRSRYNDFDAAPGNNFLSFNISQPGTVYVAYHKSGELTIMESQTGISRPEWLQSWTDTGYEIQGQNYASDMGCYGTTTYRVYSKTFSAGTVTLGSNSGSWARFWIDDVSIKALNMPPPVIEVDRPIISVSPATLNFGEVKINETAVMTFEINNAGIGTLSGSINPVDNWITVEPLNFNSNNVLVNVTVDNSILAEPKGDFEGKINITSNGGNATVTVKFTATCVLASPNPYNPSKGLLKFYGSGIVPLNTKINIYSLSGELIKSIVNTGFSKEMFWDGKDEYGKEVVEGIYLYTYQSSNEKGTGKITLIK